MEADRRLPAVGFERQQALAQHLLTLQHKAGVLCRDPTPGALRGCVRAAGEFESWLSDFETGLPGLQLALCQDSFQAAQASQALARQLSADAVSTLDHLCSGREGKVVSEDAGWLLSRPLLRLLLWLLPVHVPAETPAQPPEPESAAGLSTDWKQGFAASYVRDVATPRLADVLVKAALIKMRAMMFGKGSPPKQDRPSARLFEECLVLLTLINRVYGLARELASDSGVPLSHEDTAQDHTIGLDSPLEVFILTLKSAPALIRLFEPVKCWFRGKLAPQPQHTRMALTGDDNAVHYQPSAQLAHAVGLWGIPVMMVDSISRLIITQVCRELHLWLAEPITFSRYGGVCECSRFMLEAWDFISPDQTEYAQCLPLSVEMHMKGLALMIRMAAEWAREAPGILFKVVAAIEAGVDGLIIPRLSRQLMSMDMSACRPYIPPQLALKPNEQMSFILGGMYQADQGTEYLRQTLQQLHLQQRRQQKQKHLPAQPKERDTSADCSPWLRSAVAAAESLRLLLQISIVIQSCGGTPLPEEADQGTTLRESLYLMRLLRPASPAAYAAGAPHFRGWASCLWVISNLLSGEQQGNQLSPAPQPLAESCALPLRILIDEMKGALVHTASSVQRGLSCDMNDSSTPSAGTAADGTASQAQSSAAGVSPTASPVGQGTSGGCVARGSWALSGCGFPADSTVLLVSAATTALYAALPCLRSSKQEHEVLTQGFQQQGRKASAGQSSATDPRPQDSRDDVATTLDAVLLLAHDLASGGRWWLEAKAKDPLLLVEMLYMMVKDMTLTFTVVGAQHLTQSFVASKPGSHTASLWSHIARGSSSLQLSSAAAPVQAAAPMYGCTTSSTAAPAGTSGAEKPTTIPGSNGSGAAAGGFTSKGQGRIYLTGVVLDLATRLYTLVADPELVGVGAKGPAAWLFPTSFLLATSLQLLEAVPCFMDSVIDAFIEKYLRLLVGRASSCNSSSSGGDQRSGSASTATRAARDAALPEALQLSALLPQVPWADLKAAVMENGPHVTSAAKQTLDQLGLYMCTVPLLRAVCMLAMLGQLSQAQTLGVVSVLEGPPAGSNKASFPLEEPQSLAEHRQQHNITLADLSTAVLFDTRVRQLSAKHKTRDVAEHLVLALNREQLPMVATVTAALSKHAGPVATVKPEAEVMECLEGPLGDVYLGWVQACLLKVINEVLDAAGGSK